MSLKSIRERLAAATPGPWKASQTEDRLFVLRNQSAPYEFAWVYKSHGNDAHFIAHAPTDIAILLECAEALEALCDAIAIKETGMGGRENNEAARRSYNRAVSVLETLQQGD